MEITVGPTVGNTLLTSPNVGRVVRVGGLHVLIRAGRGKGDLRRTRQTVQGNGQFTAGRVIVRPEPGLLVRVQELLLVGPLHSLVQ